MWGKIELFTPPRGQLTFSEDNMRTRSAFSESPETKLRPAEFDTNTHIV